jgi:DNA-binding MarR family transcriptional regulator
MPRGKSIDWEAEFHVWAALPESERIVAQLARRLGVGKATVFRRMKKDRWVERTASIDSEARRKARASVVRSQQERVEDVIRIAMAARMRYAQRLRDDFSYKITATEVAALTRIEMLVEDRAASTSGHGELSEETKERLALLPVYVQERMLLAAATGATMDEILEIEGILDAQEDAELRTSGSGSREAG